MNNELHAGSHGTGSSPFRAGHPSRARVIRAVFILVFVALVVVRVVGVFTSFRGPAEGFSLGAHRPAVDGFLDVKGAVHVHSHWSHDSTGSFDRIAEAARRVGLDFVVIADHVSNESVTAGNAEAQAMRAGGRPPLFIIGAEIGSMNHALLAFPLQRKIDARRDDVLKTVTGAREQAAAVFVSHAERFISWNTPSLDGIEVYNLHAEIKDAGKVGLALRGVLLPPGPMFRGIVTRPDKNLRQWDAMLESQRMAAIGSVDAHAQRWSAAMMGGTVGIYERAFKVVTTHALVRQLDAPSVVESLRRGRSYVVMDIWRDGTGFSFKATDGRQVWQMGDEAPWSKQLTLNIRAPAKASAHVIRNGQWIFTGGADLRYAPPDKGVYRVEVFLGDKLWIISNPIYVR